MRIFYFCHQDYSPVEIMPEMVAKLQKLSLNFQRKYFVSRLSNYLADLYFHGCLAQINLQNKESNLPLANNSIKGVDREFYEQLEANNYSQGHFDPGWLVIREEEDGSLAVQKNELTFHVQRDRVGSALPHRHLKPTNIKATINDLVTIKLPHNRWQDEFYVAISDQGSIDIADNKNKQIIEIYFNVNPEGVITLTREFTQQLNDLKITFTFKVLDNPNNYPCYDAGILTFFRDDYLVVVEVIKSLYSCIQSNLNPETPLCSFKLAPGIGLAEISEVGFANSRCGAIASGLLAAWDQDDNSSHNRLQCIIKEFSSKRINCKYPYLNDNFEHIYHQLC
ncbi:MAG: hypothetical protein HC930_02020 [Hydrococcus sp. SU_1_0]|nr:hypothetical protein [Hydrococcus sp. SU_1_0]